MAMIKCSYCGEEISNTAATCPHCGCPKEKPFISAATNQYSQPQEEYLVCPYCNSKELHAERKGFSGGKALAGVVLLGGVGLLAGTLGSKDVRITCLKCGKSFKAGEAKVVKPHSFHSYSDSPNSMGGVAQNVPSKSSGCMVTIIAMVIIASLPLLLL